MDEIGQVKFNWLHLHKASCLCRCSLCEWEIQSFFPHSTTPHSTRIWQTLIKCIMWICTFLNTETNKKLLHIRAQDSPHRVTQPWGSKHRSIHVSVQITRDLNGEFFKTWMKSTPGHYEKAVWNTMVRWLGPEVEHQHLCNSTIKQNEWHVTRNEEGFRLKQVRK